jgi:hypothetical protein
MRRSEMQRDAKILHTASLEQPIKDRAASQSLVDTGKDRGITEESAGTAAGPAEVAAQHAPEGGEARAGGAGDEREIQAPATGRPVQVDKGSREIDELASNMHFAGAAPALLSIGRSSEGQPAQLFEVT